MLGLANIDLNVFAFSGSSHNHTGIDLRSRSYKKNAALLRIIQTVGHCLSRFKSNQRPLLAVSNVSLVRFISIEDRVNDPVSLGIRHEFRAITDQTSGGNPEFKSGVSAACLSHRDQFALTLPQLLNDISRKFFRHINIATLHRL